MFCASCGKQNDAGYKFCASCGESLQPATPPPSPSPPSTSPTTPLGGPPSAPVSPPAETSWSAPQQTNAPPPPPSDWGVGPPPPPSPPGFGGGGSVPAPPAGAGGGLPLGAMAVALIAVVLIGMFLSKGRESKPAPPSVPSAPASAASAPQATTPEASPSPALGSSSPAATDTVSAPAGLPTVSGATTTVKVVDPVMCREVDNEARPVKPTTRFEPSWPFFCSLRATGLKKGSKLVGVWQSPSGKSSKREIVSDRRGDYYVYFSLSPRGEGSWEAGRYSLAIIADGVLQQTVQFEVVGGPAASASTAPQSDAQSHVEEAVTCPSVDSRHRPLNPTTTFATSVKAVIVAVHVRDVKQGRRVSTRWFYDGKQVKEIPIEVPRDGSGWLSFRLTNSRSWPVGAYKIEVYYDGTFARTTEFAVR